MRGEQRIVMQCVAGDRGDTLRQLTGSMSEYYEALPAPHHTHLEADRFGAARLNNTDWHR